MQAPKHTPGLGVMLADAGVSPAELARTMNVHRATVGRWMEVDRAPRPVMLWLWTRTRWGMSDDHCNVHNEAMRWGGLALALRAENAALRRQIRQLEKMGGFGAANAPTFREATSIA